MLLGGPLEGTHRVYNFTVEEDHVYRVGIFATLVHNNDCDWVTTIGTPDGGLIDIRNPNRPVKVTPGRIIHILDGDATGGGHRPGTGKPGKSEFPYGMSDDDIIGTIVDVATDPKSKVTPQGSRQKIEGSKGDLDIRPDYSRETFVN